MAFHPEEKKDWTLESAPDYMIASTGHCKYTAMESE
jgi:hypothetical protein